MSITTEQVQGLSGRGAVYAGDRKVGGIGQVYLDDSTGEPTWVTTRTGLFGTAETFVPLQGATLRGDDIVVDLSEDAIKGAPRVDADGQISPAEEDELYRYYGLGDAGSGTADDVTTGTTDATTTGTTDDVATGTADDVATGTADDVATGTADDVITGTGLAAGTTDAGTDSGTTDAGTTGHDTSGPTTDDAMTRSEERLNVGTQTRESGRARLRKYVTTETVSQTVPLQHEEVTLQREPITEANAGGAYDGPAISEEEHEVVLHEEVPVVEKEVVAVERIKLGTETVTDETTVSADVRKEQVELEDPTDAGTERR